MTEQRPFEADAVKVAEQHALATAGYVQGVPADIDYEYLAKPKRVRFYRSVLLQMILFGA